MSKEGIMKDLIQLQKKIAPEIIDITEKRYSILRTLEFNQPIGRRALAVMLNKSERWVRSELDVLKEQGLIDIQTSGMSVTEEGKNIINHFRSFIAELRGITSLAQEIKEALQVKEVLIVPGNTEEDWETLKDIAKIAFEYIEQHIQDQNIIAVSGGYSVLAVADNAVKLKAKDITVVPARGGIKADLERQANIVAAKLANNIGGSYHLLHLPDNISEDMLNSMISDPDINKVIEYIRHANIFIFGLSSLESISRKRNFTAEEMTELKRLKVKAEAFGCYFDEDGNIVHKTGSIGIRPEDLKNIELAISIGGGASKAEPIILVNKGRSNSVIVTDEAAAHEILKILEGGLSNGN
ncbi:MAG: Cro/Cl family transcriptional regulator [Clostridia bacterium]|jgi:central glycolytic genes regulator|nr:Cro/Cl family transcriptional regulator [Clostridia bacterium]